MFACVVDTNVQAESTLLEEKFLHLNSTFINNDVELDFSVKSDPQVNEFSDHINLLDDFEMKEHINEEGLRYIAGYVAYRFSTKYPQLGTKSHKISPSQKLGWIECISRGKLMVPSEELFSAAQILNQEFLSMHGESLSDGKKNFTNLAKKTASKLPQNIKLPFEVLLCLARTRTYIRLRMLNKQISFLNTQRKLNKKMGKFTNKKK